MNFDMQIVLTLGEIIAGVAIGAGIGTFLGVILAVAMCSTKVEVEIE